MARRAELHACCILVQLPVPCLPRAHLLGSCWCLCVCLLLGMCLTAPVAVLQLMQLCSAGALAGGCPCRAIWSPAWVPSMVQALPATLPAHPSALGPSLAALNHQELAPPLRWCCHSLAALALGSEVFSLGIWEARLARVHSCRQAGSLTGAQAPLPAALCHPHRAGRASPPASLAAQGMPSCPGHQGSRSRARGRQGRPLACRAVPVAARVRASSGRAAVVLAVAAPMGSSRDWAG